jgi:flavin reductase (DIM6/NTAB) family NADH-FMN oxidoreductase RutF
MFFEPVNGMRPAPLTHNPLNALVCPRPIGWVSTINHDGTPNLAPFSYFNAVSADPPYVVFAPNAASADSAKDTFRNLQDVPEFVINLVDKRLVEAMNATSGNYAYGVNEFAECGIEAAPCRIVRPPRVKRSRAVLECTVFEIVSLPIGSDGRQSHVVIGQVVGIHIDDELIVDGKVDEARLDPVARLGYFNYADLGEIFELRRPD